MAGGHRIVAVGMAALLTMGLAGIVSGCPWPSSPSTPTPAPTLSGNPELIEIRALGLAYWDTFNSYNLEALLAYLEPSYRDEREEALRNEVRLLSAFGVKLGVSVASEPEFTGPGEARMYVNVREPLGSRRVLMRFQKSERWMITYAQEVEEGQ